MKILAADGIAKKGIELLQKDFEVDVKDKLPAEELLEIIPQYDAIIVRSASKITKEVIDRAENLKIIGRAGVGVDNIDIPAATAKGIIVINSPGGNTIAATEHTMAMMLSMSRNIPIANETTQKGEWNRKKYTGVELRGKTLGIIGMGRIGSGVAKRAMAFDMDVIGYDPYLNEERAKALDVKVVSLDELIEKSDFITVHMPINDETRDMINKDNIAKMKDGVRLINCARGGIINEQDLADAVKSGKVAGAAIDVYTKEPPTDNPLRGLDHVVLTPHLGASTVEAQIGVSLDVAHGIKAALSGQPVSTAVNMPPVSAKAMSMIRPYLSLAERLGVMAQDLSDGAVRQVEAEYDGKITEADTRMVTMAVLKGILSPVLETNVNYVNAPGLADERNIDVKETKNAKKPAGFDSLISVRVNTDKDSIIIKGALFGEQGRIVDINDFRVDVDPHAELMICPHENRPGIIGTVGTLLGQEGINISSMEVGKTSREGTNLMVLTLDSPASKNVMRKVVALDGIVGAKRVDFSVLNK